MNEEELPSADDSSLNPLPEDDVVEYEITEGVAHVIEFFGQEFGLALDQSGNLTNDPTSEQLTELREWHENTTSDGIQMPDIDTFTAKMVLARALMPQTDENGQVQYLFGKGVGAELALQGDVVGRVKQAQRVPYRTHSDFEIYAVKDETYASLQHSDRFRAVFGSQEIYPTGSTKGLHDLPDDYLYQTAETVQFGGLEFLVPKLELQFVDKFEKANEPVERKLRQQTDAEWLSMTYDLDTNLVHSTIDNYVIEPVIGKFEPPAQVAEQNYGFLTNKLAQTKERIKEEEPTLSEDEIGDAVGQDFILSQFCRNRGIRNITDLIDGSTTQLKEEAVSMLTEDEARRQTTVTDNLRSKHEKVDLTLQMKKQDT